MTPQPRLLSPKTAVTGIRRRVIALGLPLSLIAFWLVVRMEQTDQSGLPTGLAIYYPVVVALLLLTAANAGLRRITLHHALNRSELLCLYSMMAVGSSFACWEMWGTIIPALAYPAYWQATAAARNPVAAVALSHLPAWALVHDPVAATQIFHGHRPWESPQLTGWALTLSAWGGLLALSQAMAAAGCRLLYDRWTYHEKLSYPLTALPLEISDPSTRLWSNHLFQFGFVLTVVADLTNGFHLLYPSIPAMTTKMVLFNADATTPAWQTVGSWPLTFHPLVCGLAFLLPLDLLFSCWFFFLLSKVQLYMAGAWNVAEGSRWQFGGNVPGLIEQNCGAFLALGFATLWGARAHLRRLWQTASGEGASDPAVRRDVLILCFGAAVWAVALRWLGLPTPLIPLFLLLAALLAIIVTRLRVEMGLPVHNLHGQGPEMLIGSVLGPTLLPTSALAAIASLHALLRSQQGHVMPHQMEGAFMQDKAGPGAFSRRYWAAVMLAGLCAALIGPWIFVRVVGSLGLENQIGGYNPFPNQGWGKLAAWTGQTSPPDLRALGIVAIGFVITLLLIWLRQVWVASPFHPLGYAICGGWGLSMIATPLFLAWGIKWIVLRYGGLEAYRRAIPFAYGLILGEFVAGMFWTILGVALNQNTYRIWLF